jgi:hypothetical protein
VFRSARRSDLGRVQFPQPAALKSLKFERGPDGRIIAATLA